MKVIKQLRLVHNITLEDTTLKQIAELDRLSTGVNLDTIAQGAISSGLDECIMKTTEPQYSYSIQARNKDSFLTYCEDGYWAEHVPCDSVGDVTELTSEIYDAIHTHSNIIYGLMMQVDIADLYDEEEGCTVETVECKQVDNSIDVHIILTCEPNPMLENDDD